MYIPDSSMAQKALDGLEPARRELAEHFANRIGLLPPETLNDEKRIKHEMLLELQGRFSPEEAARISFTYADVIVSIALSVVRDRHEALRKAQRMSLAFHIFLGVLVSVAIVALVLFFTQEPAKPVRSAEKAETKAVAPTR
jgi:sensor c-di-GMP phosphodiesterase-like protein